LNSHWVWIDGEYIRVAVVEAVTLVEVEVHRLEDVMAGEFETTRDQRVLAAFLSPVVEHVT
jgi:hypothetical protein